MLIVHFYYTLQPICNKLYVGCKCTFYAPPPVVAVVAGAVWIIWRIPLYLSLYTKITPVPETLAAVTALPPKNVNGRVIPLSVNVIGSVCVVPSGMADEIRTANNPTGEIFLNPSAKFTAVSDTEIPRSRRFYGLVLSRAVFCCDESRRVYLFSQSRKCR